jgi:uncharacterized membrane protein YvbJ
MFCSSCGTQNLEDAKFCTKCGKAFSSSSVNSASQTNENYGLNKPLSLWNVHKIKNPEQYDGYSLGTYWILAVLSFLIPIIGIILFFINFNKAKVKKTQGQGLLFNSIAMIVLMLIYISVS